MLKDYKEQIQDADLVLVGIGRELRADRVIDFKKAITNEYYQNLIDKNCLRERVFIIHERDRSV